MPRSRIPGGRERGSIDEMASVVRSWLAVILDLWVTCSYVKCRDNPISALSRLKAGAGRSAPAISRLDPDRDAAKKGKPSRRPEQSKCQKKKKRGPAAAERKATRPKLCLFGVDMSDIFLLIIRKWTAGPFPSNFCRGFRREKRAKIAIIMASA
jgi:hypothetical protein